MTLTGLEQTHDCSMNPDIAITSAAECGAIFDESIPFRTIVNLLERLTDVERQRLIELMQGPS